MYLFIGLILAQITFVLGFLNKSALIISDGYIKDDKPPGKSYVSAAIDILDISEIRETDYSIECLLHIMLSWNDSRIEIEEDIFSMVSIENRWYSLPEKEARKIWKPLLYIDKIKSTKDVNSEINNFISITPDATRRFYTSFSKVIRFGCPMNFKNFPLDQHICFFKITPNVPIEEIELIYYEHDPPWGRFLSTTILKFEMKFDGLPERERIRPLEYFSGFKPKVSYSGFQIQLQRKSTPYVFNYYLPAAIFVIVSWLSFIIPSEAIPGRISLLITTLLVLVNITNSAFSNSPTSQGINIMQVYLLSCLGFVFLAKIEYACVLFGKRFLVMETPKESKANAKINNWIGKGFFKYPRFTDKTIDGLSLTIMPILFILFNIVYWNIV